MTSLMVIEESKLKPIRNYLGRPEQESPALEYSGFPSWYALLIAPNREEKAFRWLKNNVNIIAYWPHYTKQARRRGKVHYPKLSGVMPGFLFVPADVFDANVRRDEIFSYVHSRGFMRNASGHPAVLSKADIAIIQNIEAKLNLPPERKGVLFTVGQQVKFANELYAAFWGTGTIFEVASESRIGVEVQKLFGRPTKVFVPASEIEAM